MLSWLVWSLAAVFGMSVFTWNQRLRSRRFDALRKVDPDMAARMEQHSFGGGAQSMRIRGFDKNDQF